MERRPAFIAVVGEGDPRGTEAVHLLAWAEEVGRTLAAAGATVITGGLGGVMRAASQGAASAGGMTLGILPGDDRGEANEFVRVAVATGLGVARNLVVVTAADAVVAIGGRHGTLTEIAFALRMGRHVVGLGSWRLEPAQLVPGPKLHRARDPHEAASMALRLAAERSSRLA